MDAGTAAADANMNDEEGDVIANTDGIEVGLSIDNGAAGDNYEVVMAIIDDDNDNDDSDDEGRVMDNVQKNSAGDNGKSYFDNDDDGSQQGSSLKR